ncbi:MAG: glutaredoxin family protein [Pseudomonadota bacterium]
MSELIFYTRPECHLCDEAEDLLSLVAPARDYRVVDIEDEIALLDRYGVRVPVLRLEPAGTELGWPFDAEALQAFLQTP